MLMSALLEMPLYSMGHDKVIQYSLARRNMAKYN